MWELERVSGIESASCASLAISFISMALHRPVRSDVAICANLELEPDEDSTIAYEASNLVTLKPVSNIESRIRSARCAAIPTIVLASSQRESVEKLPDELRSGLFIEYCDSLEELFDLCFVRIHILRYYNNIYFRKENYKMYDAKTGIEAQDHTHSSIDKYRIAT